jgi:hypothetical protein
LEVKGDWQRLPFRRLTTYPITVSPFIEPAEADLQSTWRMEPPTLSPLPPLTAIDLRASQAVTDEDELINPDDFE